MRLLVWDLDRLYVEICSFLHGKIAVLETDMGEIACIPGLHELSYLATSYLLYSYILLWP